MTRCVLLSLLLVLLFTVTYSYHQNYHHIPRPSSIHRSHHNYYHQPHHYASPHYEQPQYVQQHQPQYAQAAQNEYYEQQEEPDIAPHNVNIPTPPQYPPNSLQFKVQQQLLAAQQAKSATVLEENYIPYSSFFSKLALAVVVTAFLLLVLLKYCLFIRKRTLQKKQQRTGYSPIRPTDQLSSPTERVNLLNTQNVGYKAQKGNSAKRFLKSANLVEKLNCYFLIASQWTIVMLTQRRCATFEELLTRVQFQDQKLLLSPSTSCLDKNL